MAIFKLKKKTPSPLPSLEYSVYSVFWSKVGVIQQLEYDLYVHVAVMSPDYILITCNTSLSFNLVYAEMI